jgi:hypothetical protein
LPADARVSGSPASVAAIESDVEDRDPEPLADEKKEAP